MKRFALGIFILFVGTVTAAEPVNFSRDVRPILTATCFKCHGPDLKKGGLDLQSHATATAEAKSGERAVVPGQHAASELIRRIQLPLDDEGHMPPKGVLTAKQIETLKAWIDQGAKYEEHWSYVPPQKFTIQRSKIKDQNPIDVIVGVTLSKQGLSRNGRASKETLIRRLSLDLTGLPPTPAEVESFVKDTTADAYDKLVSRLLASPHFGEHWARMWLDLARYADTNGYEKDDRRTIWPYRDWVIDAFNRDLPYDQFTREQIAGDLLPHATRAQKIATGFHRNTMVNTEGGTDEEEFRTAAVVDRVNTTAEVWLGVTMACAQCHNHKYDPFTQAEYYRLFAYFNSTADKGRELTPEMPLPSPEDEKRLAALKAERRRATASAAVLPYAAVQSRVIRIKREEDGIAAKKTLVMKELPKPRDTHVMLRGEFRNLGDKVSANVPDKLHVKQSPTTTVVGKSRLDLANWLVSRDNPLAARVMVNRLWAKLFGRGIVETLEDFGVMGEPPSHPELLDGLAVAFADNDWSVKKLLTFIVTSETYKQSSAATPEKLEKDPFNRLFSRGPRVPSRRRDGARSGLGGERIVKPQTRRAERDAVSARRRVGEPVQRRPLGDPDRRRPPPPRVVHVLECARPRTRCSPRSTRRVGRWPARAGPARIRRCRRWRR